jgi:hypothetical protein
MPLTWPRTGDLIIVRPGNENIIMNSGEAAGLSPTHGYQPVQHYREFQTSTKV